MCERGEGKGREMSKKIEKYCRVVIMSCIYFSLKPSLEGFRLYIFFSSSFHVKHERNSEPRGTVPLSGTH